MSEKKVRALKIAVCALCVLALCALCALGVTLHRMHETEDTALGVDTYRVWQRFDRQNDVFYQLAQIVEESGETEDALSMESRFAAFCDGANCLARDAWNYERAQLERAYPDLSEKSISLMQRLFTFTVWYRLQTDALSTFTDEQCDILADTLYALAEQCDRGVDGSFAACIAASDVTGDAFLQAQKTLGELLETVESMP